MSFFLLSNFILLKPVISVAEPSKAPILSNAVNVIQKMSECFSSNDNRYLIDVGVSRGYSYDALKMGLQTEAKVITNSDVISTINDDEVNEENSENIKNPSDIQAILTSEIKKQIRGASAIGPALESIPFNDAMMVWGLMHLGRIKNLISLARNGDDGLGRSFEFRAQAFPAFVSYNGRPHFDNQNLWFPASPAIAANPNGPLAEKLMDPSWILKGNLGKSPMCQLMLVGFIVEGSVRAGKFNIQIESAFHLPEDISVQTKTLNSEGKDLYVSGTGTLEKFYLKPTSKGNSHFVTFVLEASGNLNKKNLKKSGLNVAVDFEFGPKLKIKGPRIMDEDPQDSRKKTARPMVFGAIGKTDFHDYRKWSRDLVVVHPGNSFGLQAREYPTDLIQKIKSEGIDFKSSYFPEKCQEYKAYSPLIDTSDLSMPEEYQYEIPGIGKIISFGGSIRFDGLQAEANMDLDKLMEGQTSPFRIVDIQAELFLDKLNYLKKNKQTGQWDQNNLKVWDVRYKQAFRQDPAYSNPYPRFCFPLPTPKKTEMITKLNESLNQRWSKSYEIMQNQINATIEKLESDPNVGPLMSQIGEFIQ